MNSDEDMVAVVLTVADWDYHEITGVYLVPRPAIDTANAALEKRRAEREPIRRQMVDMYYANSKERQDARSALDKFDKETRTLENEIARTYVEIGEKIEFEEHCCGAF